MNHLTVTNRQQFRAWLAMHNQDASECWVDVKRGIPKADGTFWYVDAVEEALCFGWIDSTYKKLAPDQPASQRFVPRQPGSAWSELNKERCRRMIRLGKMTAAGYARLPDLDPSGLKIDPANIISPTSDKICQCMSGASNDWPVERWRALADFDKVNRDH